METCKHCGETNCLCKHKKYIAKVVYGFYGSTKEEADEKLKEFYSMVRNKDLPHSTATYPGSASQNKYDEGVKDKIVDLTATLIDQYNISDEELDFFIGNLKGTAKIKVADERRWAEAENREEQMKEDRLLRGK